MTEDSPLIVERNAGVLDIRLNRPASYNAFTPSMLDLLSDALASAGRDAGIRAVTLTGAGKAFAAGADLAGFESATDATKVALDTLESANRAVRSVLTCPVPVVAGVHGVVAGSGVSLALAADWIVASQSAVFTVGFTKIGLMPDAGATCLIAASTGRTAAMRLCLRNPRLDADEALRLGLASEVVADTAFDERVRTLASELSLGATMAMAATKRAINAPLLDELEEVFERERSGQTTLIQTHDFGEGVHAFREKRPACFRGR